MSYLPSQTTGQYRTNQQIGTEAENVIRMLEQNSDRLETVIRRVTSTDTQNKSTSPQVMMSEFTSSVKSSNAKTKKRVSWSPSPPREYSAFENGFEMNTITPETSVELDQLPDESELNAEDEGDESDNPQISNHAGSSSLPSSSDSINRSNFPPLLSGTFKSHHFARIAVAKYFHSQSQKAYVVRTAEMRSNNLVSNEWISCNLSTRSIQKAGKLKLLAQREYLARIAELEAEGKAPKRCDFLVAIGPVESQSANGKWEVKEVSGSHNHDTVDNLEYVEPQKPLPIGKYRTRREMDKEWKAKKLAEKKEKGKGKATLKRASGREDSNEGEESQPIPPRKRHRLDSTSITQSQPQSNSTSTATIQLSKSDAVVTNPTPVQPLSFTQFESFLIGIKSSAKLLSFSKILYEKLQLTNTQALINLLVMDRLVVSRILKDLGMRSDEREILLSVIS